MLECSSNVSWGARLCLQTSLVFRMLNCFLFREEMTEISRFNVCSPCVNTLMTAMNQSCFTKQLDVMFCFSLWVAFAQMSGSVCDCHATWHVWTSVEVEENQSFVLDITGSNLLLQALLTCARLLDFWKTLKYTNKTLYFNLCLSCIGR